MRILITNDDGYQAKGLRTLVRILRPFGEITVIAPKRAQSGMGMAVSLGIKQLAYKDLGIDENGTSWSYLDATPASCIKFGLNFPFVETPPDIVVSGINHGSNASTAACYSGTLGAAQEAALNGVPAIGVSLDTFEPDADFSVVEKYFPEIFRRIVEHLPASFGTYYNVNFPNIPADRILGVRAAVMGMGHWEKEFVVWDDYLLHRFGISPETFGEGPKVELEQGEKLFMMVGEYVDAPENPARADHHLMENGYISITSHQFDNTDAREFRRMLENGIDQDF